MSQKLALALMSAVLLIPASLYAKGTITKISIRGNGFSTPIDIASPPKAFTPWAGPGVTINRVPQKEGFIVDWAAGSIAALPAGLPRYEVSFYAQKHGQPANAKEELVHVVLYEYDPTTNQGYVYLPGKTDDWFMLNTSNMRHADLEGNWFRATKAWDDFVRRLFAQQ